MSLILEGIDLPEEEETISLMIEPDGTVYFYVWDSTENDKLTNDGRTNAIQIPKGHGDIKDADELINHLRKDPLFDIVERYGITGVIKSRPTILEAESSDG